MTSTESPAPAPFCEAAAEWDHDWPLDAQGWPTGPCRECGAQAAGTAEVEAPACCPVCATMPTYLVARNVCPNADAR